MIRLAALLAQRCAATTGPVYNRRNPPVNRLAIDTGTELSLRPRQLARLLYPELSRRGHQLLKGGAPYKEGLGFMTLSLLTQGASLAAHQSTRIGLLLDGEPQWRAPQRGATGQPLARGLARSKAVAQSAYKRKHTKQLIPAS